MLLQVDPEAPAPFDFWAWLETFLASPLGVPVRIALILVVAGIIRLLLQLVIRRVVNRVVTGVKKRQNVDDTRELQASPVAAVRVVQRTRALGGVLSSTVTTVVVLVSLVLVVSAIDPNATGAFSLITAALGGRYAEEITVSSESRDGVEIVEVRVRTPLPVVGLWGPAEVWELSGRSLVEDIDRD